jgi:hypothetical protein
MIIGTPTDTAASAPLVGSVGPANVSHTPALTLTLRVDGSAGRRAAGAAAGTVYDIETKKQRNSLVYKRKCMFKNTIANNIIIAGSIGTTL